MAYLLDLLAPGLGHLAARRWFSGLALLGLWLCGHSAVFIATSFEVWSFLAFPVVQLLLSLIALIDLIRVRRKKDPKNRPGFLRCFLFAPIAPVLAVVAFFAVTQLLVRPVTIRSGSMTPSVVTGDTILVQLFAPSIWDVRLGDIILVEHPGHAGRLLIKRIIGMAGDLITIRGGVLHRNERPLSNCELRTLSDHETSERVIERLEVLENRPYLVWDQPSVRSRAITVRVPQGHLFVVGDNRDRSGDSRTFGTVPVSSVHGLVTVRVVPRLTNRVFEAPLRARQTAHQRCSGQGSRQRSRSQPTRPPGQPLPAWTPNNR